MNSCYFETYIQASKRFLPKNMGEIEPKPLPRHFYYETTGMCTQNTAVFSTSPI